jgi:hypothetical protein
VTTAFNLTSWGYQDAYRSNSDSGPLAKLLLRNLPHSYTYNSTYVQFAMLNPDYLKEQLDEQGAASLYDFPRPFTRRPLKIVKSLTAVKIVLSDSKRFDARYAEKSRQLINNFGSVQLLASSVQVV